MSDYIIEEIQVDLGGWLRLAVLIGKRNNIECI